MDAQKQLAHRLRAAREAAGPHEMVIASLRRDGFKIDAITNADSPTDTTFATISKDGATYRLQIVNK